MSEERETPAPRPFKVGDRVKSIKSGDEGVVVEVDKRGFVRCSWDGQEGDIYWDPCRFELVAPAPAPEATGANATVDDLRRERDHWQEEARVQYGNRDYWRDRAEKAERERDEAKFEWASLNQEYATLFESVRAARDDERARFERETAARFFAAPEFGEMHMAIKRAKELADHYFPKEQGK